MLRLAIVVAVFFTTTRAFAQGPSITHIDALDRQEIAKVILGQMAAFKAENGDAAFAFSAPKVRKKFGSSETFMKMIRKDYGPVYNPRSVQFGALSISHVGPVQHVFVLDPNAVAFIALYLMERGDDGRWQIAGCILRTHEALEA